MSWKPTDKGIVRKAEYYEGINKLLTISLGHWAKLNHT
jgi:hypothetical protein